MWPFKSKQPKPEPIDTAALVREAAVLASQETAAEIARTMYAVSPMIGAPSGNISNQGWSHAPLPVANNYNPWKYYSPIAPTRRPDSQVSLEDLRLFAERYDVLRSCLQHLKREVFAVPIQFVPKDEKDKSPETQAQIKQAEEFFSTPGGLGGFGKTRKSFEGMVIEDVSVIGMAAIYFQPNRGNKPFQAIPFDSATIRPKVDAWGWPGPGEVWYEQWIMGLRVGNGFTAEQMFFGGLPTNERSYSPYAASPVEWLIQTVLRGMKSDQWNLSWLTDGNTPSSAMALPQEWTPAQIREWAEFYDGRLAGNTTGRQKTQWLPAGTQKVSDTGRKDQDFTQLEDSTMRRTCSIMGVQPASIGYAGDQYKESQGESMDSTSEFGAGILLEFRTDFYNDILQRLGLPSILCKNITAREEKATERADRLTKLVAGAIYTPNEARSEEGKDPNPDGDTLFIASTLQPIAHALIEPPDPLEMLKAKADAAPTQEKISSPSTVGNKPNTKPSAQRSAFEQWEKKALNRLQSGKSAACEFVSEEIPAESRIHADAVLSRCKTRKDVRLAFCMLRGETDISILLADD